MAADFPQQHWHQTSSVFMFMALFTIRAHLTGYWAPPDKEHALLSVIVPANRLWLHPDCILLWAWFVLTTEQVCWALLLLLRTKMTLGVCDHFENEAPPVYYEIEGKHSHCDWLVMTTSLPSGVSHPVLPWWAAWWLGAFTVPVDVTVKIDTTAYDATACVW